MSNLAVNRRTFLKAGALTSAGLLIGFVVPEVIERLTTKSRTGNIFSPNAFLQIGEDDSIHVILNKVEMGQGIWTTLPMLIAEELDCDWSKIKVSHKPSGKGDDFNAPPFEQATGGSTSTSSQFDRFREAGATARVMLINAAAKRLGVSAQDCRTENGYVIAGNKRISYGQVANDASKLPVPAVKLREAKDWKYIGKSQIRLDSPEKVNGQAVYGLDIHFADLLTAVVAHPPVFGAKVKFFDATKAKSIDGVVDVVQIPTGIAVLAKHYWAAKLGRDALQVEWEHGPNAGLNSKQQLEEYRRKANSKGTIVKESGNVSAALQKARTSIEREFVFPYLAHAPMEPLNCTVKISKDKCEVWVGTQWPLIRQKEIAAFLGLEPEQVIFNTPALGGSFGRRGTFSADWVMEAVLIAKATDKPVKLVWSREDDIKGGYYRPVYLHKVHIAVDQDALPTAWLHRVVGQSLFTDTPLAYAIVQNGIDYSSVDGVNGSPYLTNVPDHSIELHTVTYGVPVSAWRSVGNTHTAFVMETLVDELAIMAKKDPVDYRRLLLKDHPRHLAALNLAAEKSGWDKPVPGRFRGVAVHEAMGSFVCQVVEVSTSNGRIIVHRVVCAIDCGLAVNPDGVSAQMESGIVYGLTAARYGEITLESGQVQQSNFNDYQILRMNEMPVIEVYIVPSAEKMGGAGEPGVPPIAPALGNAIYAATGKRVTRLPIPTNTFL